MTIQPSTLPSPPGAGPVRVTRRHGEDPEAVRGRIVQAAHDRFLEEGFHRMTMDELAAELGMSKRTLYRHFRGKIEVLDAVLDLRLASIRSELDAVAGDDSLGFEGRLAGSLAVIGRRLGEVKPPFMADLRRHAPDSFRRIERFRQQYVGQYFGGLLEQGRREGRVRVDLDDRIVIEALLNMIQATVTPDTVVRLGVSVASAFDTVVKLVLEGVMTRKGRQAAAPGAGGVSGGLRAGRARKAGGR